LKYSIRMFFSDTIWTPTPYDLLLENIQNSSIFYYHFFLNEIKNVYGVYLINNRRTNSFGILFLGWISIKNSEWFDDSNIIDLKKNQNRLNFFYRIIITQCTINAHTYVSVTDKILILN